MNFTLQFQFPFKEKINSLHIPHYDLMFYVTVRHFLFFIVGKI